MKPWAWRASLCAWLALAPGTARAAEIAWRASVDCQSAETAAAQVEKLVGQSLGSIDWISFEVEVEVDEAGAHRALLRTLAQGSAPREREITGASCAEVTDAVSVAIALTISERAQTEEPEPIEEPAARGTDPAPKPVSDDPPEPDAAEPPRFAIGAGVLLDTGALPNVAPGFELTGAFEWRALRIGAFLGLLVPQDVRLPGGDRGGTFDLALGGVDVCAKPMLASVHLIACAGFEIGRISGRGSNVADPRLGDGGWYAPRAELGVGYGFAEVMRVWLRGGLALPLARPEFVLDETDSVHQPSNMSLRALLALEIVL